MALITHQGISETIANLQPNPATLKGRLINLIHGYFPTEKSLEEIDSIAAEDLIRQLWEVEDPAGIRKKKTNLSSLKSSINKDLKTLARQGKNPEGLFIGRDNVFTISDEQKNDLLQKLGLSGLIDPKDLISLIRGILDDVMQSAGGKEAASSLLKELDKTRAMIATAACISGDQPHLSPEAKTGELNAAGQGEGIATEPGADEEFEILDEAEVFEEEAEIVDDDSGAAVEPADAELLEADEFEALDETEILEEEAEIVDEEEITPVAEIGAPDDAKRDDAHALDLSHYIEPDEALASPLETLTESHDEYLAQILERFMPKFIKIPAGHYLTGRDNPANNERPSRKIFLQSFYIGQLPVTNDLFDFFVRETGYETSAEKAGFGNVVEGRISNRIDPHTGRTVLSINRGTRSQRMQGANWRHPSGPDSSLENKGNHPVVQLSRQDALAFAAWAGKRLPSEDEWEAAARGHEGLLFPWGSEWHGELTNTESSLTGDTTPVIRHGKPSMSPFGVYDLLGNVFEWSATAHTTSRPASNRTHLVYVLKGGCWTSQTGITTAARLLEPDTWSNIIGFRCAV